MRTTPRKGIGLKTTRQCQFQCWPGMAEGLPLSLMAGDRVRVRSRSEIQATLTYGIKLRVVVMPDMCQYGETEQHVLKPVRQSLDERDYRLKKCGGIVLLENAVSTGTEGYGPCDRSCFFFWRAEWLEKLIRGCFCPESKR